MVSPGAREVVNHQNLIKVIRNQISNLIHNYPKYLLVRIGEMIGQRESYEKVVPLIPVIESPTVPKLPDTRVLPNVLFVGIDSVSRLQFDRHFPITARNVISGQGFNTMYGYNKVADNTFPNLTPLLTGHYVEDLWNETMDEPFDYFPFIWKEYQRKGYRTLYMEDAPNMNTYNYGRRGFVDPPTDYYLRPYYLAMDDMTDEYLIVFFSDHGLRFGDIRQTLSGKYEERLPFMHIYVPQRYRSRNLTVN
ncbi:unnamed protein product, partial [Oppiella nova]